MKFTICDDTNSDLMAIEGIINKYANKNNIYIKKTYNNMIGG